MYLFFRDKVFLLNPNKESLWPVSRNPGSARHNTHIIPWSWTCLPIILGCVFVLSVNFVNADADRANRSRSLKRSAWILLFPFPNNCPNHNIPEPRLHLSHVFTFCPDSNVSKKVSGKSGIHFTRRSTCAFWGKMAVNQSNHCQEMHHIDLDCPVVGLPVFGWNKSNQIQKLIVSIQICWSCSWLYFGKINLSWVWVSGK